MKTTAKKQPKAGAELKDDPKQSARFREAAREAGVDPDADIDEVMRRLASQEKTRPRKPSP